MSSTEGVLQDAGPAYTSREPEFTPVYFCWGRTAHLFNLFVSSYYLSYDFRVVISVTMTAENDALFIFTSSCL